MAFSLRATGAWAEFTADGAVSIPGSPAAGDRMFLFAAWKAFGTTAQVTSPQAWTEVTEFADGSVAAGANVGSVKVGCWYRDWVSGDGNPTLDWSVSPAPGVAVVQVWQKGAGDAWRVPTFVTGVVTTAANPWTSTSTGSLTVADGVVVFELVGIRDDSATFTRSTTTALEDDGSPNVTWNGNIVESPATHISTTTSNDISADLIHRFVTTGAAAVNLTATATLSAVETGSVLWVHQGIGTNTTVTPGLATLTLTAQTPTVTKTNHQLVTPGLATLTLTRFTPTVSTPRLVTPGLATLTTTRFTPVVTAGAGTVVTPGLATLTLTPFAPTVQTPRLVTPGTASLTTTRYTPTVSTPRLVTPGLATLALNPLTPSVTAGSGLTVTPGLATLALTRFTPTVTATAHQLVTPGLATLALNTFAPSVSTPVLTTPGTGSLTLTLFPPTVTSGAAFLEGGPGPDATGRHYMADATGRHSLPTPGARHLRPQLH